MGIFNFWKKEEKQIDFSDKNITRLINLSDLICEILINNEMGFYSDYLYLINLSAEKKDETEFKNLIISRNLFGGSGALWEIYIENKDEYNRFNKLFCEYIDVITQMGIKNKRIMQIRKTMRKLV
jgi:hypothetical protein